jgi:hypothetical protein
MREGFAEAQVLLEGIKVCGTSNFDGDRSFLRGDWEFCDNRFASAAFVG